MFHAKNIQKINLKFSIFVYKSLLHSIVLVVSMTTTYTSCYGNQSIFMSNLDFQLLCLPDSLNHNKTLRTYRFWPTLSAQELGFYGNTLVWLP